MLAPLTETAERLVQSLQFHSINGKALPSRDGAVQEVFDPSAGAVLTEAAVGSNEASPQTDEASRAANASDR